MDSKAYYIGQLSQITRCNLRVCNFFFFHPNNNKSVHQAIKQKPTVTAIFFYVIAGNLQITDIPATVSETHDKSCTFRPWPLGLRASLSLERSRHNFCGQVKEVPQVLDPLVRQVPVVVTPRKLLTNKPAGLQALKL